MYQFIPYIYKRLVKNPQIIYADYLTVLTFFFLYKFVIYTCFNVLPLIQPSNNLICNSIFIKNYH